jgi:ATP-binding cassette subfamily B protein
MMRPTQAADLRRAFAFVRPHASRLVLVLGISLVSTLVSLVTPLLTRDLIDQALLGRDAGALRRIVLAFAGLGLASYGLNVISGLRYTRVSADILFEMRAALYAHLQRQSPRFYARTRLGDIVARINSDIGEIQRIVAELALAWVGNVVFLIGCLIMLVWLDWRLALLSATVLPPSLLALVQYRRRLESRVADVRQRSADIGSFLIETLQAHTLVVTANADARERSRFRHLNDRFIAALMRLQWLSYGAGGIPGLLVSLGASGVFLYGGMRVVDGSLTLGTFGAFMAYQMRIMAPVQALMGLYTAVATARVSWGRVTQLLDAPIEVREPDMPAALSLPVRGDLTVSHLSLRTERGAQVLEDVSWTLTAGQSLAVVGASGSGKSTIAAVLLRLIDPDAGAVTLDGHDLRHLRLADVRRHIRLVEQEPTLLHATLRENLCYGLERSRPTDSRGPEADADLWAAAEAAGLREFIERLPDGFETIVGERGWQLSAGERQRVALARAFLAKPAVLVLDEPTAALDPEAERAVVAGYRRVMQGRTTVVISHRRDVALAADMVVVLHEGRVSEVGPPAALRVRNGRFSQMFPEPALPGETV